jgi:type IV pilus assembly protein PilZ
MSDDPLLVSCAFKNEEALYLAYMPFIKGGGLFVRTNAVYALGTQVPLSIQLMDEPEPYVLAAKVVWMTEKGVQGNKPAGIGVQFMGENNRLLCNKIETYLAGRLKSTQMTDTM